MRRLLLLSLNMMILAGTVCAQTPELALREPARIRSMAGTGRSFAAGSGSMYLNPATLGASVQYLVEGNYVYGVKDDLNVIGVNWADSYINRQFAAGVGYNYFTGGEIVGAAHAIDGAASFPVFGGETSLHVGFAGHYFVQKTDVKGLGDRDVLTGDVGLLLNLGQSIKVGAVGYNLLSTLDSEHRPALGAGLSFWTDVLGISADLLADFGALRSEDYTKFQQSISTGKPLSMRDMMDVGMKYMGTIIVMPSNGFMFRSGVSYDAMDSLAQLGCGMGFIVPQGVGFELAYSVELGSYEDSFLGLAVQFYPMHIAASADN